MPADRHHLVAVEPQRLPGRALLEGEGNDAHADEVGAVDALEGLGDHGPDAEQLGPLRRPVARRAGAVFAPGEDDERHALRLVAHGDVVDRPLRPVRIVDRDAALDARQHLVLDADIGEGAAHHHLMIAAPRAVLVEVHRPDLMVAQIFACRARGLDRAGRRDVVGGDRIEEQAEDPRLDHVGRRLRRLLHADEIGRVLHIGRAFVPGIGLARSAR